MDRLRHWSAWRRGTVWRAAALLFTACLAVTAAAAQGERRVALVIGQSHYKNVPALPNTVRDAQLLAKTLQGLGFEVVGGKALIDLDRRDFEQSIRTFRDRLSGASVGLFYYAGHGLQVDGENYLVPVDANLSQIADIDFELIDANLILRQMNEAGAPLNIVLLDACRNNPFARTGTRTTGAGLAQMQAPKGTLISYATEPGKLAQDGPEGGDGPYAKALAEAVVKPGEDLFQVFNDVGIIVDRLTDGLQRPWVTASPIEGRFYFANQLEARPQDASAIALEIEFWDSVRESNDPAMFSSYLERYPDGAFASLAQRRIARLSGPQASLSPKTPPASAAMAALTPSEKLRPPSPDGTWKGILACGVWMGSKGNYATNSSAYTSHDFILTVKGGVLSGERHGISETSGMGGGRSTFEESYSGRFGDDGSLVINGQGEGTYQGHYDISFRGRIREDGDLEAEGSIGGHACTLDYQHAQP